MGDLAMDRTETTSVEAILRDELARETRALGGIAPVISHLLESPGQNMVSDAVLARLRGMLGDLAAQLLCETAIDGGAPDPEVQERLAQAISAKDAVLNHLYAVAVEGQLLDQLQQRRTLDPVLSPLLQELIASEHAATAELAMSALAAQSRFVQSQRRMGLSLAELPAELFALVLNQFSTAELDTNAGDVGAAINALKSRYDEGAGRLALLSRLVGSMRAGSVAALELEHAGLSLFASALAKATDQPRDLAVLACHDRQSARLALSLRAAGLDTVAIERQFVSLNPVDAVSAGIMQISVENALTVLSRSSSSFERAAG